MLQQYEEGTEAYQFTKEKLSKIESLLEKLDTEIKGSELYQQTETQISELYNSIIDTINNAGSNIPSTDNNPAEQPAEQPVEQPTFQNTNVDISEYKNKSSQGFVVTTGNKTYDLSEEDKELLYTIVAAESDKTPDAALAGVRNQDYESFRSNGTTCYSSNMITSTGNRYK